MKITTLRDTIAFIKVAHDGQHYGDLPYFTHPIEVAMYCGTHIQKMAGLLHDVIEDTAVTETELREIFGDIIVDIVVLLTKDASIGYRENIQRIIDSGNRDAMAVKLADNTVNHSGDKSHMKPDRAKKLMARYEMSIEMLSLAISQFKLETK
jgi:guanosine-3',5'-bis(diphosphate) 3'-pyrophosphohydrolase|tara:strand:- start:48 stop:503 length:456 start_codon:yes stop_codon:yes gene_type:complete